MHQFSKRFLLLLLWVCGATLAQAQSTVTIGSATTSASYFHGPMYRSAATSTFHFGRYSYLYTSAELNIPAGSQITSVEWFKTTTSNFTGTGSALFNIFMKNSTLTSYGANQAWTNVITGSSQVAAFAYNNSTNNLPGTSGWVNCPVTPFTYNGNSLEIAVDLNTSGLTSPFTNGAFNWDRDNTVTNRTLGIASSTAAGVATLNNTGTYAGMRPVVRITYILPANAIDGGLTGFQGLPPCSGVNPIEVTLANTGVVTINTATINWTLNGVAQAPVNLSGLGLASNQSTTVTLNAGFNFVDGINYSVSATLASVNGGSDINALNNSISQNNFQTALSGIYSIGGVNPDFATLSAAAAALNLRGVCGTTIMFVRQGVYNEQVQFNNIPGASPLNFTIIAADPNNTGPVDVRFTSTAAASNYVLRFNGVSYIAVAGMELTPTATTGDPNGPFARCVEFLGNCTSATLSGCTLNGLLTSNPFINTANIYHDQANPANRMNGCIIDGNQIINGSFSVYVDGLGGVIPGVYGNGNVFSGNTIRGFNQVGLNINNQNNCSVVGNTVLQDAGLSFGQSFAAYLRRINGLNYSRNRVDANGPVNGFAVYMQQIQGSINSRSVVSNNFVTASTSTDRASCIYVVNANYTDFLHNSLNVTSGSNVLSAAFLVAHSTTFSEPSNNCRVWNNVFVNTGGQHAAFIDASAVTQGMVAAMNNNDLFVTGPNFGVYNGFIYPNLSVWQSVSGFDGNSVNVDPLYVSRTDLHAGAVALNDAGRLNTGVVEDIDFEVRCPDGACPGNTARPDLGADEFDPVPTDIALVQLLRPVNGNGCDYSGSEIAEVRVRNTGSLPLNFAANPLTIVIQVSGANAQTISMMVNSGSLPVGGFQNYVVGNLSMSTAGNYILDVSATVTGDGRAANNTLAPVEIQVDAPISALPYTETFDQFPLCSSAPASPCALVNGWRNEVGPDNWDWSTWSGPTPTIGTGPNADFSGTGRYLYMESNQPGNFTVSGIRRAILRTPCFDYSNVACPGIAFYYHMAGTQTGTLSLQGFDRNTNTWVPLWSVSGAQQAAEADAWRRAELNLGQFTGQVTKFRFIAENPDPTFTLSDIALDQVTFYDIAATFASTDFTANRLNGTACDLYTFDYAFTGAAPTGFNWTISPGLEGKDYRRVNGSTATSQQQNLEFLTQGVYSVTMTLTTGCQNLSPSATKIITVGPGTPSNSFSLSPSSGTTNTIFTLTASSFPTNPSFSQFTIGPATNRGVAGVDFVVVSGSLTSNQVQVRFLKPGPYSIRHAINSPCGPASYAIFNAVTISNAPLGQDGEIFDENNVLKQVIAYPNPFSNNLNLMFDTDSDQEAKIRITDLMGRVVYTQKLGQLSYGQNVIELPVGNRLAAGVYMLNFTQGDRKELIRIVKE